VPEVCFKEACCLHKDPRQRLQSIGEARIAIDNVLSGSDSAAAECATPAAAPATRAVKIPQKRTST